jgi:putative phage-type endonuclease
MGIGPDMEQRSDEWFAARKGRVTASMVGAILGHSPNLTRAGAMRRMVRDAHGAEPEFTGNIATRYGEFNEDGAVSEYEMETGNKVEKVGFIPREDWAGCSPDGLINDDGGLETKCPFGKREKGDLVPLADQPHYYDQVQFSLWVTDRKFWHFYQWAAGRSKLECVLPDQAWQDENLPRLRQFHAEFLAEDPAPHLEARRVEIDTLEAARIIAEYDQLTEAIENAEARKKELLAEMVRQANGKDAVYAGRNLTKIVKAGSVSYAKALAKYAPKADLEPFRGKPSEYWIVK